MISLPDFNKAFEYENNFYLSCDNTRLSKILSHYELFKQVIGLPGAIVECGVFKGASLVRFAGFRDIFGNAYSNKIIGFDIFGEFPETNFEDDKKYRSNFINAAGASSISVEQLKTVVILLIHENNHTSFVIDHGLLHRSLDGQASFRQYSRRDYSIGSNRNQPCHTGINVRKRCLGKNDR